MPDIQAFRGIRYDLGHVGSLADVVAPPYDVIDAEFQDQLYDKHPANVIRLELNREEPGDDEKSNRYTRAGRFFKNWQSEGVLFTEPDPAIYVYHQEFTYKGETHNRRGFIARVRLERFGEGKIFPHEETMSGPKQDRLLLTRACRANLSPVFGLFPDPENEAQELLERATAGKTPLVATDHLGVIHRLWPVTDPAVITAVNKVLGPKPTFIADGHHRYETACNYRDERAAEAGGSLPSDHAANFVLMTCIGMSDPGMLVLPTHRLFRGLPELDSAALVKTLGDCFTTRLVGEGADLADTVWNEIENEGAQGTIGFFTRQDERWTIARVTDEGQRRMADLAQEHSPEWCDLGVALLHRLVIENLLDAKELPKPRYVHLVEEVVEGLDSDEFPLAALIMPATLEHIRAVSEHQERMPAKSTYFYPKLLSGLVFNPLD
ncbi:MAG: DUF1015 domain-containing protein [Pirellulales bacterium]|nr:DUF1015 domain-containing protein [Pirellulales bacterium]